MVLTEGFWDVMSTASSEIYRAPAHGLHVSIACVLEFNRRVVVARDVPRSSQRSRGGKCKLQTDPKPRCDGILRCGHLAQLLRGTAGLDKRVAGVKQRIRQMVDASLLREHVATTVSSSTSR